MIHRTNTRQSFTIAHKAKLHLSHHRNVTSHRGLHFLRPSISFELQLWPNLIRACAMYILPSPSFSSHLFLLTFTRKRKSPLSTYIREKERKSLEKRQKDRPKDRLLLKRRKRPWKKPWGSSFPDSFHSSLISIQWIVFTVQPSFVPFHATYLISIYSMFAYEFSG